MGNNMFSIDALQQVLFYIVQVSDTSKLVNSSINILSCDNGSVHGFTYSGFADNTAHYVNDVSQTVREDAPPISVGSGATLFACRYMVTPVHARPSPLTTEKAAVPVAEAVPVPVAVRVEDVVPAP